MAGAEFSLNSSFFNFCLAALWPTLGHYQGDSLTHPVLITAFGQFQPVGHCKPHSKVKTLSPAEDLARFELGTLQF